MEHALTLGILAILGYGLFHIRKQRIKSKPAINNDIPPFLGENSGNQTVSSGDADWTETLPVRNNEESRDDGLLRLRDRDNPIHRTIISVRKE